MNNTLKVRILEVDGEKVSAQELTIPLSSYQSSNWMFGDAARHYVRELLEADIRRMEELSDISLEFLVRVENWRGRVEEISVEAELAITVEATDMGSSISCGEA